MRRARSTGRSSTPARRGLVALGIAVLLAGAIPAHTRSAPEASGCAHLAAPLSVPGQGNVQVFAMQYFDDLDAVATYASIRDYLDCYFTRYVDGYRDPSRPGLVVFNELTTLPFAGEGSRGAAARLFAHTPAATFVGHQTNQPIGAVGGAVGLLAASYSRQIAYYTARYPQAVAADTQGSIATLTAGGVRIPADIAFLAVTDTYVRAAVQNLSALAKSHGVSVVAGALLPVFDNASACSAHGYAGWIACPGWAPSSIPADMAAIADPDLAPQYAAGQLRTVYVAETPHVENVALFFDPLGRLYDIQPKVNLTPTELTLSWQPAPSSSIHAVALRDSSGNDVPGIRLGVAISLDAFEHADSAQPCSDPHAYMTCLDSKGVNLLLQPEFNDGTPECASWSDFQEACRTQPVWQQLEWMFSAWYDVEARDATGNPIYPHFQYAVNPFMVGNLYDLTGDGQSAIFARSDPRAHPGYYAGDRDATLYAKAGAYAPHADPATPHPESSPRDRVSLAQIDGPQPGFLAVVPWMQAGDVRDNPALAAGSTASLESCTDGLVSGSGVSAGPCSENHYLTTAIIAELNIVS